MWCPIHQCIYKNDKPRQYIALFRNKTVAEADADYKERTKRTVLRDMGYGPQFFNDTLFWKTAKVAMLPVALIGSILETLNAEKPWYHRNKDYIPGFIFHRIICEHDYQKFKSKFEKGIKVESYDDHIYMSVHEIKSADEYLLIPNSGYNEIYARLKSHFKEARLKENSKSL